MKRVQKILALLLAASLTLSLLAACGGTDVPDETASASAGAETTEPSAQGDTRTVTLSDGYVVEGIPAEVERIAALFGPSYERLYVLGAEDKIVMCSDFHRSNWPWSQLIYQHVDDEDMAIVQNASSSLNVEDLLEYDLDVCFYWSTSEVLKALENVGIAAVPYSSTGGVDSIKQELYSYAQVLGDEEAMAIYERYADYFDTALAEVQAVTSQIPDEERKVVHYGMRALLSPVAGDSDVVAIIEYAGGIPSSTELTGSDSTDIDKEQLIAWNPDAIFIDHTTDPHAAIDEIYADSDYANISAVQNGEIYGVPTGVFYWDAGLQMVLLVKWMAATLYPDYFPDMDMVAELQEFYSEFYHYDLTEEQAQAILNCENPA